MTFHLTQSFLKAPPEIPINQNPFKSKMLPSLNGESSALMYSAKIYEDAKRLLTNLVFLRTIFGKSFGKQCRVIASCRQNRCYVARCPDGRHFCQYHATAQEKMLFIIASLEAPRISPLITVYVQV